MKRSAAVVWGFAAALAAGPASAQKADVMHWWTSGGESRAVAVFAKEYNARASGSMMPRSARRRNMRRR